MASSKFSKRSSAEASNKKRGSRDSVVLEGEEEGELFDSQPEGKSNYILPFTNTPGALAVALNDLRTAFGAIQSEHRNSRNRVLRSAYEIAFVLRENADDWRDFCRLPDWRDIRGKPHIDRPDEAMKHTIRLMHGLRDRAGQKKASTVNIALSRLWGARMLPSEIEAAIQEGGGTSNMATAERARHKAELAALANVKSESEPKPAIVHYGEIKEAYLAALKKSPPDTEFSLVVKKASEVLVGGKTGKWKRDRIFICGFKELKKKGKR